MGSYNVKVVNGGYPLSMNEVSIICSARCNTVAVLGAFVLVRTARVQPETSPSRSSTSLHSLSVPLSLLRFLATRSLLYSRRLCCLDLILLGGGISQSSDGGVHKSLQGRHVLAQGFLGRGRGDGGGAVAAAEVGRRLQIDG